MSALVQTDMYGKHFTYYNMEINGNVEKLDHEFSCRLFFSQCFFDLFINPQWHENLDDVVENLNPAEDGEVREHHHHVN